jgi:hypothetical protein
VRGGALVQEVGQVAAADLEVTAGEFAGDHGLGPSLGVDDRLVGAAGLAGDDVVEDAHALQHGPVGGALEVDGLPARAHRRGALDDGDGAAVAGQPEGEGGAGDARAGDQDSQVLHAAEHRQSGLPVAGEALTGRRQRRSRVDRTPTVTAENSRP